MSEDFALAEKRVLAALLLDWYRPGDRLLGSEELFHDYSVDVDDRQLSAIFAGLDQKGWVLKIADKASAAAVLKDEGYKPVRRAVLEEIGNPPTFDVNWEAKEIYSEAKAPDWFPASDWWKWYTIAEEGAATLPPQTTAPKKRDWHLIVAIVALIATIVLGILALVFR